MMVPEGQTSLQDSAGIRYPSHRAGRDLQSGACGKKVSQDDRRPAIIPRKSPQASEAWARHRPVSDLPPSFLVDGRWLRMSFSWKWETPQTRPAEFRLRS